MIAIWWRRHRDKVAIFWLAFQCGTCALVTACAWSRCQGIPWVKCLGLAVPFPCKTYIDYKSYLGHAILRKTQKAFSKRHGKTVDQDPDTSIFKIISKMQSLLHDVILYYVLLFTMSSSSSRSSSRNISGFQEVVIILTKNIPTKVESRKKKGRSQVIPKENGLPGATQH